MPETKPAKINGFEVLHATTSYPAGHWREPAEFVITWKGLFMFEHANRDLILDDLMYPCVGTLYERDDDPVTITTDLETYRDTWLVFVANTKVHYDGKLWEIADDDGIFLYRPKFDLNEGCNVLNQLSESAFMEIDEEGCK